MTTVALTREDRDRIIITMREKADSMRADNTMKQSAAALLIESELGIRIGDICPHMREDSKTHERRRVPGLRLSDIVRDSNRYRLDITEEKTGKRRTFTVNNDLYCWLRDYADAQGITRDDELIPLDPRTVQRNLKIVADELGLANISTHSFRKYFATDIYERAGRDIVLVQTLLQHSSATVTQRYINIQPERIDKALADHSSLI